MRFVRAHLPVIAFAALAGGCSGDSNPTAIEIPIAELRMLSGGCSLIEGQTCSLTAEAKSPEGVVISNPVLRWTSNNSTVASVEGNGRSARVTARGIGSATITVSNSTGTVSDDARVSVLIPTK